MTSNKHTIVKPPYQPTRLDRIKAALCRAWPFSQRTDQPTYMRDMVGDVHQWDERDIVFTRSDLFRYFGVESPQFAAYYAQHPEHLDYDTRLNTPGLGLGRTGGIDRAMFAAQFATLDRISPDDFVDGDPAPEQIPIPPERAASKVKALARILGADLVGIGPLRQEWVYSHAGRSYGDQPGFAPWGTPIDLSHHTHAIAMAFAMNDELMQHAPDFPVLLATAEGYATGAWVAIQLAQYIRMLGYAARAHHFHNYQVICVPVAVDCGIGELSRAGYLLTREYGLGVRLAIVTTNLPLAVDRPVDLGVQSFCEVCKICAESCPIGAIPTGDKVVANGVKKWKLDEEKCYRYWKAAGTDCGLCMSACPWTHRPTWFHRAIAALASRQGPHQRWLTWAHKLWYGTFEGRPRPPFIDGFEGPASRQQAE